MNLQQLTRLLRRAWDQLELANDNDGRARVVCGNLLESAIKNMVVGRKSFHEDDRRFYSALYAWGGPRVVRLVGTHLSGPGLTTVQGWLRKEKIRAPSSIDEGYFRYLAEVYGDAMAQTGAKKGLVWMAEDETAIVKRVVWDQAQDTFIGW
jgi:hypothetical protein